MKAGHKPKVVLTRSDKISEILLSWLQISHKKKNDCYYWYDIEDDRIYYKRSMKGSSKLDTKPSKYPDALIFPNNFINFISCFCNKATELIFPVYTSKNMFNFEFREDPHKDFKQSFLRWIFVGF